jgi:nucleoside-diphosphate-sugar epimerase
MRKNIDFFCVQEQNSLREVMKKIGKNGQGLALIVDVEKKLLGIVTDGDIRRAILSGMSIETSIKDIMNEEPVTIKQNYSPLQLKETFLKSNKKISQIPIVDEQGKIVNLLLRQEIHSIMNNYPHTVFDSTPREGLKTILVVGGAGYIGSVLIKQLLDKGYKVKILDKLLFGKEHLSEFENNENLKLIHGDISNVGDIFDSIENVDAVVQLGEIVGDPACELDPKRTQQINYISCTLLARICKYFQINRFIYASSCSVYGASNKNLLSEESPLRPVSLYARMKIESEKSILDLADNVFCPSIVRFSTVFGKSPRMRFDLVVNILTLKAVKEGKLTIFGGDQWRPHVHVSDAAKSIVTILESPLEKVREEVFNVGSNENNYTINQIGKMVKECIPEAELVIDNKEVDKRDYKIDFSKIKTELGYVADFSVMDGIKEITAALREGKYQNYNDKEFSNHKMYQIKQ